MVGPIAYSGCALDRAVLRRTDGAWLADRLRHPTSRIVPVWRDRSLVGAERPRLVALGEDAAGAAVALSDCVVFLGLGEGDRAWFACDVSAHEEERLAAIVDGASFQDLGRVAPVLAPGEGAVLAYARAITHWHRRHRFCGACGSATEAAQGGHLRACTNPECRLQHFPRTDPVVIMLVTREESSAGPAACLLARQKQWMPGLVSALAGFVEPGETLEEAVRREVLEESGLIVETLHYRASQPWPFPSSLMLGFHADVRPDTAELNFDREELEDARWFRRDEVAGIRAQGLRLPFRGTIARALIEAWLAGGSVPAGS